MEDSMSHQEQETIMSTSQEGLTRSNGDESQSATKLPVEELLLSRDPLDAFYHASCRAFYLNKVAAMKGLNSQDTIPRGELELSEGCWKTKQNISSKASSVDRWMTWEDVHLGTDTKAVGHCSGHNYRNLFVDGSYLRGVHVHISEAKQFIAPCIWKSGSTSLSAMTQKLGARKPNDPRLEVKQLVGGSLNYTHKNVSETVLLCAQYCIRYLTYVFGIPGIFVL